MPELVARGATITLDALFEDVNGAPADATTPQISIIAADGTTTVNLAAPTHIATGHYQYAYPVPADAIMGAWEAVWYGIVAGIQLGPIDDGFTVVSASTIATGTPYTWAPATADVARLIADRVLDNNNIPQTDFGAGTIPTAAQVTALITPVTEEVHAEAGDIPTAPEDLEPFAKFVAAQGTAAMVLASWFPSDDQGPEMQRIYEANLDRLAKAVDAVLSSGALGAGHDEPLPVFGFPTADMLSSTPVTTWQTHF